MEPKVFSQSCSMPIDDIKMRGTEKDGSTSTEYCSYCYNNGKFISPELSLEGMKVIVKTEMEKQQIPDNIVQIALATLPQLKRWSHSG